MTPLRLILLLLLLFSLHSSVVVVNGYDFLITASAGSLSSVLGNIGSLALCPHTVVDDTTTTINNSSPSSTAVPCPGQYYRDILDGSTLDVIGGLFQDAVYDNSGTGNRIGTAQGYAYYYTPQQSQQQDGNDGGWQPTTWKWNVNKIMFLNDGDIILLDNYIIAATGRYSQYTGGYIVENNNELDYTTAEITLMERTSTDTTAAAAADTTDTTATATANPAVTTTQSTFRMDGTDGYYYPITNTNNTQIGEKFQNSMLYIDVSSDDTIGITQGYGYTFPSETFLSNTLGIETSINSNRILQFHNGEYVYAINNGIVFGSGPYAKYEGGTYIEDIYDSSITFILPDTSTAANSAMEDDGDDPTMYITTVGRYYEAIIDPRTNEIIGNRFQNPIYDSSSKDATRIGTEQGYVFNFPSATNTRELSQGNRQLYLLDGTLTIYNDIVVAATGRYTKYIQKILLETKETTSSSSSSSSGTNGENGGEEVEETTSYAVQFEEPPAAVLTAEDVYANTNWGLSTPQAQASTTNDNVVVPPVVQDEKTTIALSLVLSIVAVLVVIVGIALSVVVYLRNQKEENDGNDDDDVATTLDAKKNEHQQQQQEQQTRMNNQNDTNGHTKQMNILYSVDLEEKEENNEDLFNLHHRPKSNRNNRRQYDDEEWNSHNNLSHVPPDLPVPCSMSNVDNYNKISSRNERQSRRRSSDSMLIIPNTTTTTRGRNYNYNDDDDINNKARISAITTNAICPPHNYRRATIDTTTNSQSNRRHPRATIDTAITNNGSSSGRNDSRRTRRPTLESNIGDGDNSVRLHKLAMIEQMNNNLSQR